MNEQPNNTPTDLPPEGGLGSSVPESPNHGDCCEDCKRTCRRNFWTSILNSIIKVSTIILAALGIQSFKEE